MANKVTITTIAKACEVSITTVSLVMNEKPGISEETRRLVLNTAKKLGYKHSARSTARKSRLSTIGMLVKTEPGMLPPSNPFYSQIITGVDVTCQEMNLNMLFSMLPVDEHNHPKTMPPILENSSLDGLLLVGTFVDKTIESILGNLATPIVLVDGYSDTASFDVVVSDNFKGAYQAVEHLLKLGHTQIGLVGTEPESYPSLLERRHGYLRALKENAISDTYIANFNVNKFQGEAETIRLIEQNPQISALFCANDNVALGAIRAAQQLGRQVPQDLSIIGYDDTYLATSTSPALTTMHVDTLAMGRAAVHLLTIRIEKPDAARFTVITHPELVERGSTAPFIPGQQTKK